MTHMMIIFFFARKMLIRRKGERICRVFKRKEIFKHNLSFSGVFQATQGACDTTLIDT